MESRRPVRLKKMQRSLLQPALEHILLQRSTLKRKLLHTNKLALSGGRYEDNVIVHRSARIVNLAPICTPSFSALNM